MEGLLHLSAPRNPMLQQHYRQNLVSYLPTHQPKLRGYSPKAVVVMIVSFCLAQA